MGFNSVFKGLTIQTALCVLYRGKLNFTQLYLTAVAILCVLEDIIEMEHKK